MSTHILNLQFQLVLSALVRSLEGQVLQEMGGSVGLVGLRTRTSVDVDADCAGSGMRIVFGGNGQSI